MAMAEPAAAQTRGAIVAKAGVNIERAEDALSGESPAAGADLLIRLNDRWDLGAEVWFPDYFTTDFGVRHRDILFTVGARRRFSVARVQPFVGFGLGLAVTQEKREGSFDTNGTGSMFYLAGGADVPLGNRFLLVPEVRVTIAAAAAIVRPAIGVGVRF
jgi:hypothetical protein